MFINALIMGLGGLVRWVAASGLRIWAMLAAIALGAAVWQADRAAHWAQTARQTQAAWADERKAAAAAKLAAETRYRSLADDADAQHAAALAQGDARLAAYIAAHRVQPAKADPARAAPDYGAAISANPTAPPIMAAISEGDLKICDANYVYAQAAHDWAVSLHP